MTVRNAINYLMDFNMDAEIVVSTGPTFDDYEEPNISWGGPDTGENEDGDGKSTAKFIYINNFDNTPEYDIYNR